MERIVYRITLDAMKTGIQRTLQGFDTSDRMARQISINLVAGSDTYEIPMDHVHALMYVTMPSDAEPSIYDAEIVDNTILYTIPETSVPGIVKMQLKLIEGDKCGAKTVLLSPMFELEVVEGNANDKPCESRPAFSALEKATAQALEVYNSRLIRVDIDDEGTFYAYYADGTTFINDTFKQILDKGDARLSQSWAVGGTGSRDGEDTDNSKYYAGVSKSASVDANQKYDEVSADLAETKKRSIYTVFSIDFETGMLTYVSENYKFNVNQTTGKLDVDGGSDYTPDQIVSTAVDRWLEGKTTELDNALNAVNARMDTFTQLPDGSTTGDAELMDIRVGADGNTYASAGEAVRTQLVNLDDKIKKLNEKYDVLIGLLNEGK